MSGEWHRARAQAAAAVPLPLTLRAGAIWQWLTAAPSNPYLIEGRWFVLLPALGSCGIGLYFLLRFEPPLWIAPVLAVIGMALLWQLRASRGLAIFITGLLIAVAGFGLAQWQTARVSAPIIEAETRPIAITGTVVSLEPHRGRMRVVLKGPSLEGLAPGQTPARIRLSMGKAAAALSAGDRIAVRGVVRPPPMPVYPGGYDFRRQLFFEGIGGVGYAMGQPEILVSVEGINDVAALFEGWRQAVSQRIALTLDGEAAAVADALLTGQRGNVPDDVYDDLRAAGLAHLLAISGLHLGIVSFLAFGLLRKSLALIPGCAARYPIKKCAAALTIIVAALYCGLAGATIPTQRAFVMVAVAMVAVMLDRDPFNLRLLGLAAVIVIILDPQSITGPSFQMSFAAVASLITAYGMARRRGWLQGDHRGREDRPWWERMGNRIGASVIGTSVTTIIASTATAPFALLHFQTTATLGIVANLAGVPLTGFLILPAGAFALLLMPFGLEAGPLMVMGQGIDWLLAVAHDVASMPYAVIHTPPLALGWVVLGVLASLAFLAALPGWRLALAAFAIAPLLTQVVQPLPDMLVSDRGPRIAFIDTDGTLRIWQDRRDTFVVEAWREYFGAPPVRLITEGAPPARANCDRTGCLVRTGAYEVAWVRSRSGFHEACGSALVIVAAIERPPACEGAMVIGEAALRQEGSFRIDAGASGETPTIRSVARSIGLRPWVNSKTGPSRAMSTDGSILAYQ